MKVPENSSPVPEVYIGLGSNLNDRQGKIRQAIKEMEEFIDVLAVSSFYETEPEEEKDQPLFINACLKGRTKLSPRQLFLKLKEIEVKLGRRPTYPKGPRVIDLDILFYDDLVLEEPDLIIPHPRIAYRTFVLLPLAEIAPNFRHPVLGKTIEELLRDLNSSK